MRELCPVEKNQLIPVSTQRLPWRSKKIRSADLPGEIPLRRHFLPSAALQPHEPDSGRRTDHTFSSPRELPNSSVGHNVAGGMVSGVSVSRNELGAAFQNEWGVTARGVQSDWPVQESGCLLCSRLEVSMMRV